MLSTISSVYDPLGLAAPFLLEGRKILQQLCRHDVDWDDDVPSESKIKWQLWRDKLHCLEKIKLERCFKPKDFGNVVDASLHHFSDASEVGYGQSTYLRQVNDKEIVSCSLVIGKSRVSPLKVVSIPRLELTAATLSIKVGCMMKDELNIKDLEEVFWTDSQVVLAYIKNESKRFKIFVANRIELIKEHSRTDQWNYVNTKENPADDASRGLDPSMVTKTKRWFYGPDFLWKSETSWRSTKESFDIHEDDPEVRVTIKTNAIMVTSSIITRLEQRISEWSRMKRVLAWVVTYIQIIYQRTKSISKSLRMVTLRSDKKLERMPTLNMEVLQKSELFILKMVQAKEFKKELKSLQPIQEFEGITKRSEMKKIGGFYKLDPFIDKNGLLRVGGRLNKSRLDYDSKHPIIIPKSGMVTKSITRWCHKNVAHGGRGASLNSIRSSGYWVINGNSMVRNIISQCITCRRLRGQFGEQKMADLPTERSEEAPPFSYCGVDMFGPFYIKERRKELKRYCALFTCLSCRAVHIETTNSMETDSFIQALRRFISRRGNVRMIRSDNGSNFVGAENEFKKCFKERKRFVIFYKMMVPIG